MTPSQQEAVRKFCELADSSDIFDYLGVSRDAPLDDRLAALREATSRAHARAAQDTVARVFLAEASAIEVAVRLASPTAASNERSPLEPRSFPKQHETAAELCDLVGVESLQVYLGLSAHASPEELTTALQARRKWAQGQQNNPKYKAEAMLLIRDFADIAAACREPLLHLDVMAARREQRGLPQLRATLQAIADSGAPLTPELLGSMETLAHQLGIGGPTLQALIVQLFGLPGGSTPAPVERAVAEPTRRTPHTPILDRDAPTAPRRPVLPTRPILATPPVQKDRVVRQDAPRPDLEPRGAATPPPLGNPMSAPTAPPVRREFKPPSSGTPASPSGARTTPTPAPRGRATLRLASQSRFAVVVHGARAVVAEPMVEFLGTMPPPADVVPSAPWLLVAPARLDPLDGASGALQRFSVAIDPAQMPSSRATGEVVVRSRTGDVVTFHFEVERRFNWMAVLRGAGLAIAVASLVILAALGIQQLIRPGDGEVLTIHIDPGSEFVLFDGERIGQGDLVQMSRPPAGAHTILIQQRNFRTHEQQVDIAPDGRHELRVDLVLDAQLAFVPGPNEVAAPEPAGAAAALGEAIEPCLAGPQVAGAPFESSVLAYLLRDGSVGGIHLSGNAPPAIDRCVRRRVAALRYAPLSSGDYARLVTRFQHP
jgi:hypothetical protein